MWGGACESILQPLRVLQKRALKYVRRVNNRFPSRDLFSCPTFKVLTINNLYKLAIAKYVHCCVKDLSFHTLNFGAATHPYLTRQRNRLRRPLFRSGFASSAVSYTGPVIYEEVPNEIRLAQSADLFATNYKLCLFESQSRENGF